MNTGIIDIFLATGTVLAALAIAVIGSLGLVVWLAGGKADQRKNKKTT